MRLTLSLLLLLLLTGSTVQASILVNGSFEDPLVPVGSFTNFPAGSLAIPGWTIVGVDSSIVSGTFQQSGIHFVAQHGNQYIDLAGVTSNSQLSGVSQSVATVPGQSYTLSFYVGSAFDNRFFFPTTVDLSINGGPRVSYFNPAAPTVFQDWKQFIVPFVATTATTNLTFYNGALSNNFTTALDNVTLESNSVPEPASVAIWSLVAAGVYFGRRSRQAVA